MAELSSTFSAGIEVEVGRIERELKKLWEEGGGVTRASLVNFAICCEGTEAMSENTQLIARLTQDHACRALLICVDPASADAHVRAWISAHCHLSRARAKQICCEQITFVLPEESQELIPNIVFSHLDSDLPLYLWWQEEFHEPINPQLWKWVDRLYFDSQQWPEPKRQFNLLRQIAATTDQRLTLRDLNWTRFLHLRQALAQIFDHPHNLAELPAVTSCTIRHAPGFRSTAILLTGWLCAQLKWELVDAGDSGFVFKSGGHTIALELEEQSGASIGACTFVAGDASFSVTRETDAMFFHAHIHAIDGHDHHHLIPAGPRSLRGLLNEDLMRGMGHQIYLKALLAADALW